MLTRHLRLRWRARRPTTMSSQRAGRSGWLPGPDAIEVGPRWLRVGGTWCRTLAVTGYPHEVGLGWLEPILAAPGTLDVALHVEPISPLVTAERLRKQLARLESTRRLDADTGRLADFGAEAAADDAAELARHLARGQGRLFRVGLYVTIRARSEQELDEQTGAIRALLGSLLLIAHPATFRTLQGWTTTLPIGVDALKLRRTFDTEALAAGFPFASAELPHTDGVLYGRNLNSQGLVFWDRFAQRNYNAVLLAPSGSAKSYLAKLEALRWLYRGVEVFVVDPEREYQRLASAVGALGGSEATTPVDARGAVGLAVAAAQAGFTGQGLRLAVAVGLAESGGNPTARGPNPPTPGCPEGSVDRGAWQLNTCYHPEVSDACAADLACAARET